MTPGTQEVNQPTEGTDQLAEYYVMQLENDAEIIEKLDEILSAMDIVQAGSSAVWGYATVYIPLAIIVIYLWVTLMPFLGRLR
ncbi:MULTISPECIES: hypothetical protein [Bacillales]|uniref:Uncharacterized protein n=1 Tax=Jeotgalibacillus terrae TaxID=587735 RepID=A0ABW5ZJH8_9BACL|nr:hypothetical protein [Jeotgalibacillus terrae]MBM7581144.1 hypothetical protein [Jeotgalibacillus terrae]